MSDLVALLRYLAGFGYGVEISNTMAKAADRIEQLEKTLAQVRAMNNSMALENKLIEGLIVRGLKEKKDD